MCVYYCCDEKSGAAPSSVWPLTGVGLQVKNSQVVVLNFSPCSISSYHSIPVTPPTRFQTRTTYYHLFPVPPLLSKNTNVKGQVTKTLNGPKATGLWGKLFQKMFASNVGNVMFGWSRGWSQDPFMLLKIIKGPHIHPPSELELYRQTFSEYFKLQVVIIVGHCISWCYHNKLP